MVLKVLSMFFFFFFCLCLFFFQAEDGIRYLVRSRGLGDVYKRQLPKRELGLYARELYYLVFALFVTHWFAPRPLSLRCLLYTSDAADERSSVDLGGRRIINKKNLHPEVSYSELK